MAEEQQPEQDPGSPYTQEEVGGFQAVILEIDAASADLGDFMRWCATQGDLEDEEHVEMFTNTLNYVYSYCRSKNDPPIEGTAEDG